MPRKNKNARKTIKTRVEKTRGGGRYTESEYFSFIRSGLRSKSNRWPVKYDVLAAAKRNYEGPNKRQKFEFQCNHCKQWFPQKQVSVDHIIPAGTLRRFGDLARFVEILFCEKNNLQVLCIQCHKQKSQHERKQKLV